MKNFILLAILAAGIWFGWMKFAVDIMPKQTARDFVEDLRLNIDGAILSVKFSNYHPPLPEPQLMMPKGGIEENFRMTIEKKADVMDPPDSRVVTFLVRFNNSAMAQGNAPRGENEYRIVLVDKGSYIMPEWHVTEFRPSTARPIPKPRTR
jgi:hypothetical protein